MLDGVRSMQRASRDVAALLAGVEEVEGKKRVLVGASLQATNKNMLEGFSTDWSSCSGQDHALSYDFL